MAAVEPPPPTEAAAPGPETDESPGAGSGVPEPPLWPEYADPNYVMPTEIEVKVGRVGTAATGMGSYEEQTIICVAVEKVPVGFRKPNLGGYRHKRTGLRYHHAGTQTEARTRPPRDMSSLRERDTQTYETVSRRTETVRESGTQMRRVDLDIDDTSDLVVYPKPYFSAAQQLEVNRKACITMQRYWRGYLARCRAHTKRMAILTMRAEEAAQAEMEENQAAERHQREIKRRLQPRTKADFELLYNELGTWRHREVQKIHDGVFGDTAEAKRRANAELLAKESKLLQTIDNMKGRASKEGRQVRVRKLLKMMSQPQKWELGDGHFVDVDTPFSVRAKELMDLYEGLTAPLMSTEERLNVLLSVKWTVAEFDCTLSSDIIELIEREADLLNRGRSSSTMTGLRQRVANLFLEFIQTPEFNPAAQQFSKVPDETIYISPETYTTEFAAT
uniref:IQ motif and ubiquitin-like domain-containing protein n=1 Tax=Phaeomonas parva TaxID=124430 RepID=A0A7S1U7X5_9STRA